MRANRRTRHAMGPWRRAGVVALAVALLGGCSSAPPTAAPAADFAVGDLVLAGGRVEVVSGEDVEVTVRVQNGGDASGTYEAELSVDGAVERRQGIALDPGASSTLRFVITAGQPGDHVVALGPATATLRVAEAEPVFAVSGLQLASTPPEILPGDELRYQVTVTNTGSAAGEYEAAFSVDGVVESRQTVALGAGEDRTLSFVTRAGSPGEHRVAVGETGAALTVLEPAAVAVTGLQLSESGVASTGEVAALVTVRNEGGAYGTLTVEVRVDGKVKASRPVTVPGGEERTLEIPLAAPAPGRHTVAVGDLEERLVVWKITRPSSGTVLVNRVKGGMGRLTIKNGDDERDVVLVLARSSSPAKAVLAVYVRANKSYTVRAIKDGTYVVYFTFGERWDSLTKAFTRSATRSRFEDTIRFRTTRTSTAVRYSVVTISLHTSGGGGVPTDPVDDDEFPPVS